MINSYRPVGSSGRNTRPFFYNDPQYYPYDKKSGTYPHMGNDYGDRKGADVLAPLTGVVIEARTAPITAHCGYGTRIVLEHDAPQNLPPLSFIRKIYRAIIKREYFAIDKIRTTYAHLDSFCVDVGDTVLAGDKIGEMGDTGVGDTHLHFEVNLPTEPNQRYVETVNCGEANGFKIEGEAFLLTYYGEPHKYTGIVIEPQGMVTRECAGISCQKTGNKLIAGASVAIVELQDADGYIWGRLKNFENMPVEWVATSRGEYIYIELTEVEQPTTPPIDPPTDCEEAYLNGKEEGRKEGYAKGLQDAINSIEELQT